ncbi:hypothetical protein [Parasulfitobacter algicola]|uniref:DUF4129 domain-containing protein n=1 Tax=Parasulfitobacter algicola TaxID=2614809 RepID=A0ABX2IMT8_9RHOB|nr:hypothetical protein [Sulfitobacter algicola]NSX53291.1 hypothetical protein [Sulfitobacter algicola]
MPISLAAQDGAIVSLDFEQTESGQAYQDAIDGTRLANDVTYLDPNRPLPDLLNRQSPDRTIPEPREITSGASEAVAGSARVIIFVICAVILGGIIFLFMKFGGVSVTTFQKNPDNTARQRSDNDHADVVHAAPPSKLDQIEAITDRQIAITELMRSALVRAAQMNNLRLQRSWTARDALRKLPRDWQHLMALRNVTREAELAHFGDRPVAEDVFQTHLAAMRPLFGGR